MWLVWKVYKCHASNKEVSFKQLHINITTLNYDICLLIYYNDIASKLTNYQLNHSQNVSTFHLFVSVVFSQVAPGITYLLQYACLIFPGGSRHYVSITVCMLDFPRWLQALRIYYSMLAWVAREKQAQSV